MNKFMILGASVLQLPAILKAKEMGLQVIAVDMDKNAIGFRYSDVCIEISTLDIPEVVKAAKQHNIDGIMTLASDFPMRTVAAVAKELNIVGLDEETALKATNKVIMRECLKQNNVPIPIFFKAITSQEYYTAVKEFENRFIVKPADNSGSRGVFLINDKQDKESIKYAFEYSKKYSRSGQIIVEEYMEGDEVSVETLAVNGKIYIIAITDKITTGAPRFVEMGHTQPCVMSNNIKTKIAEVAIEANKAIGIINGPSHTEIKLTEEGPKIVELGARLGGDNITTHLVPLSTGVDMVECCIRIALGQKPDLNSKYEKGAAIRYFQTRTGKINNIKGLEEARKINGVKQINFVKEIGDNISVINSSSDRVGFVIAQSDSVIEAVNICMKAINTISIDIIDE